MNPHKNEFPSAVKISFEKVFDAYRERLDTPSASLRAKAKAILKLEKEYPILSEGFDSEEQLEEYREQVDLVLEDLFSPVLENNEIKMATIPFKDLVFKSSKRLDKILKDAGKDFHLELMNFDEDNLYIMGCTLILNMHFGFTADFRRPLYYEIPDINGSKRSYRAMFNGDFVSYEKNENAKDITEDDYLELLENFDNIDIWKEKFPPNSWTIKGFVIANLYDATTDVSLSQFKENLLKKDTKDESFVSDFEQIIATIFNLSGLKVGYTIFDFEEGLLMRPPSTLAVDSYLLNDDDALKCNFALCEYSYGLLFEKHESYCIADVAHYFELYPDNPVYKKLYAQNIGSAIITSIVVDGRVSGILEIVSEEPMVLNSVNANKLKDIMPFLVDAVRRSNEKAANEIELIIQRECTSIHPSVHWKFKREAQRVLHKQMNSEEFSFSEIVFDNVYPLYGQIDIKGSSQARNNATRDDLIFQLKHIQKIVRRIRKIEQLPIYEQLEHRITEYLSDIKEVLKVNSERQVLSFLKTDVLPLFDHLETKSTPLKTLVDEYHEIIDPNTGLVYKHRKAYDESVTYINKAMASILDKKQIEAQLMYPHYFERFKTDGVEHNLYIGESITKDDSFHKIYLYNLRLWQLQVMCEMENSYYQFKERLSMSLNVASMILVFNSSLALRFRMDEKRFDVDGTYNARYEVVKKRVDKANIKGTNERVTQPGKISIIYSQKNDEREYLKYISFLQSKKYLDEEVEIVKLEDLQGVTGLKAIRVNVLYSDENQKDFYTYEDLMKEIDS